MLSDAGHSPSSYGGLVGRKNVLAVMMQSFVSMGWTTVLCGGPSDSRSAFRGDPQAARICLASSATWSLGGGCAGSRFQPSPSLTDTIPDGRLLRLPDDVCHHHATMRLIHGRVHRPLHRRQGLHALSDGGGWSWFTFHSFTWSWGGGMHSAQWGIKVLLVGSSCTTSPRSLPFCTSAAQGPATAGRIIFRCVALGTGALVRLSRFQCRIRISRGFDHRGRIH